MGGVGFENHPAAVGAMLAWRTAVVFEIVARDDGSSNS